MVLSSSVLSRDDCDPVNPSKSCSLDSRGFPILALIGGSFFCEVGGGLTLSKVHSSVFVLRRIGARSSLAKGTPWGSDLLSPLVLSRGTVAGCSAGVGMLVAVSESSSACRVRTPAVNANGLNGAK